MRIGIVGAGGMGAFYGSKLARAGEDVVFIARGGHLAAMRENGLVLTSADGDIQLDPVQATDDPASVPPVDAVVLCVKLYDLVEAARHIAPMLKDDTFVVTLQNGVEAVEMIAPVVGRERVLGGSAMVAANIDRPGVVRHTGTGGYLTFAEADGTATPRAQMFADTCARAGFEARLLDNMELGLWRKFLIVANFSGAMGVTRLPMGELRADPDTRGLLERALRECLAVGEALGTGVAKADAQGIVDMLDGLPADLKPSLLEDLEHGRRLELDWLSGGVVRLGREAGVPTPIHETIYAALKPYRDGPP